MTKNKKKSKNISRKFFSQPDAACLFQTGMTTITSIHHNPLHTKIYSRNRNETRDKIPYFDDNNDGAGSNGSSITVMRGENAYLVCFVRNLDNNSISWLRHSNINLLSVGAFKYAQDPRYQIFHNSQNDTWTLKVNCVIETLLGIIKHDKHFTSRARSEKK